MDYYPWLHDDEDDSFAWIDRSPQEMMEKEYKLKLGIPARNWFPSDVIYELDINRGVKLTDSLGNNLNLMFVAPRLQDLLAHEAPRANVEYLAVNIKNHKQKLVKPPYAIANLLDCVECVDREHSDYTIDEIDTP